VQAFLKGVVMVFFHEAIDDVFALFFFLKEREFVYLWVDLSSLSFNE
jgi:hypothetical protein